MKGDICAAGSTWWDTPPVTGEDQLLWGSHWHTQPGWGRARVQPGMHPCASGLRTKNRGDMETREGPQVPRPGPEAWAGSVTFPGRSSHLATTADPGGVWPLPASSLEPPEGLACVGHRVQALWAGHILVRRSTLSRTGTKVLSPALQGSCWQLSHQEFQVRPRHRWGQGGWT